MLSTKINTLYRQLETRLGYLFNTSKLLDCLLPYHCILCQVKCQRKIDLCIQCELDLPWLQRVCAQCAMPLASTYEDNPPELLCGDCIINPPIVTHTLALFHYDIPINNLLLQLKFSKKLLYAKILGELLAQRLFLHYQDKAKPHLLIPVPLHTKRLRERGYNQALELARPVAKRLQIPININVCSRVKPTMPQSSLIAKARELNVKYAFKANTALANQFVLLIDDVMTTGFTLKSLAKNLHQAGASRIDVCCIARTTQQKN